MFQRVDKCLKGKYRCYRRWNSILHVKLSVHTMILQNRNEAKQVFRFSNEIFIKAKSDIRNQRNAVTSCEGVLLNVVLLNFPYQYLYKESERIKQYDAEGSHAFIEHPA